MPVIRKIKLGKKKTVEGEEGTNQGDKNEAEMNLCDPHQQWVCVCGGTQEMRRGASALQSCQLFHLGNPKLYKCIPNTATNTGVPSVYQLP